MPNTLIGNLSGPAGPAGQGYTWRGQWLAPTAYVPYDTVYQLGSSFVAVLPSTGVNPSSDDGTYWQLLARIGNPGVAGPPGINTATTTAAFVVPPVGQTVDVTVTDVSWIVIGQMINVEDAGGTNLSGALQVVGITGNQLTLLNPVPPAAGSPPNIPLADDTQDGLLKQVSGNTTDFVDGTNNCQNLANAVNPLILPVVWAVRLRSFNAVGNPNCEVDQVNAGNVVANASTKIIDRWYALKSGTMAISAGQTALALPDGCVPGTSYRITRSCFRVTLTTAQPSLGAFDSLYIQQTLEGPQWRELSNDVHSLSLLVRSSAAGTFGLVLRDAPIASRALSKLCTIPSANTWTLIPLPNLPVWPSGGNFSPLPGVAGYSITITLAAGSSSMMPANDTWQNTYNIGAVGQGNFAANPTGTTFDIAFVQHEPGPQCTQLMDKPFSQNLDECLRYYYKTYNYGDAPGSSSRTYWINSPALAMGNPLGPYTYKKTMARTPVLTWYSPVTGNSNVVRDQISAGDRAVSTTTGASQDNPGYPSIGSANNAATIYQIHFTADTGAGY